MVSRWAVHASRLPRDFDTIGLEAIKSRGGLTFAQDPKTAQYDGMPRNAILSGAVDIVESPKGIAEEIVRISHVHHLQPGGSIAPARSREHGPTAYLRNIFTMLRNITGIDFSLYKHSTIQRRIARRQDLLKIDLESYVQYLADHPEEVKALFGDMLIQVTGFFRDREAFVSLKTRILPKVLRDWHRNVPLRVWVPGCSTGEEAYSIAIVLFEFLDKAKVRPHIQIFASDISESAIRKARAAIYPEAITKDVSRVRLRRFFERTERGYRIAKWVRDTCLFSKQDVTADPPFAKIDLISCRNVLIYFTSELQKSVVPILHYALNPGGILWLGHSETISGFSNLFAIEDKVNKFYSKKTITAPPRIEFPTVRHPSDLAVARRQPVAPVSLQDVQREADRITVQEYAPPGVVINDALDILQVRGRPAPYLELTSGQASLNVFKLARPEIIADLRYLIGVSRRKIDRSKGMA
jgi:two-component system, chemotaxis family, CheB/CheR fusion protein